MIVLFALWYLLNWQFPMWLWVVAGLFLLTALTNPYKRKKRYKHIRSTDFPLALIMALIFGKDVSGLPILPSDVSFWSFAFVILSAMILKSFISRPDKIFKKWKIKEEDEQKVDMRINDSDDELRLNINIKNKEKNKSSNFSIGLDNNFIKELFIKKIYLRVIKENPDLKNVDFNIDDIYSQASKNRIKGEVLTVDNEKVTIVISIN